MTTQEQQRNTAAHTTPLERMAEVVPLAEAHAAEGEAARRLAEPVVQALKERGLLRLMVPKSLGGEELAPAEVLDVIETIARADGSTGWVAMILNGTFMTAWLEPEVAAAMLADPDFAVGGVFGPMGRAVPEPPGFRLSGRWPFNSGCVHATWMLGGCFVLDGDEPRMLPEGRPDWRFAFFPVDDCEIHDTWRAAGLRATSSHDISVNSILVPEEHTAAPMFEQARHEGPTWRHSFFSLIGPLMVGVPLGIARRALDETVELCRTKARGGPGPALIEDSAVQLDLMRSEAALRAARNQVIDAAGAAWDTAAAGDPVSLRERVAVKLACLHVGDVAVEVVDRCFRLGGGGALYDTSPLQRCWRDVHAATHHIYFSDVQRQEAARVHLGLADDSPFI